MSLYRITALVAVCCLALFAACNSSGTKNTEADAAAAKLLSVQVDETIRLAKSRDRGMQRWFTESAGYAVFPTVSKGGLIIGGAHGEGQVFHKGKYIGWSTLSQGSIGAQIGGQTYSEFIFFKDDQAVQHFRDGNFEFSGQASAVLIDAGASADANYENGVCVFTIPKSGAMLEASIGGQQFDFYPAP